MGFASAAPLRPKQAYETSVECSIYLHQDISGRGFGSRLYQTLFTALETQDVHRCYGIITLPNDASVALHRSFGFVQVSHLSEVGRKFDQYWDTLWMEKSLHNR